MLKTGQSRYLVSTALVLVSAAYGYWQAPVQAPKAEKFASAPPAAARPPAAAPSAPATTQVVAASPPGQVIAAPAPPAPKKVAAAPPTASPPAMAVAVAQTSVPAPDTTASAAPAGPHLADGEFIGQHEDFEWGTVQVKVVIKGGAIADVQFLQIPDHRARSAELSDMAKPVLISEAIREQKADVDVVSSATYTSMAYQDSLANALMRATQ